MGIELKEIKKLKSETIEKLNKSFLAAFQHNNKSNNNSCITARRKTLREDDSYFTSYRVEVINYCSRKLSCASGTVLVPVSSSLKRIYKQVKKMILAENEDFIFLMLKSFKAIVYSFLTSTLLFKQTYPGN
jgi:ribosomal protein S17E